MKQQWLSQMSLRRAACISAIEHSSEKTSPSSRYHMVNTIPGCAGLLPLCEASLALSRE